MRRPRQFRIGDWRLAIADQVRFRSWIYLLAQLFANHAHGRGVATGETFNKFDAVLSVGADRDRIMHFLTRTWSLDSEIRAQIFHHFQSTRHRATQCAADPDMRLPGRMLAKHW